MPAISMSAIEILPALLDKTKTQTIRPLKIKELYEAHMTLGEPGYIEYFKPRLKVGDKCKLFWKMRSKAKWFCSQCGGEWIEDNLFGSYCKEQCTDYAQDKPNYGVKFSKRLGQVEITEVFEIEMYECHNQTGHIDIMKDGKPFNGKYAVEESESIAKKDGFISWKQFCEYFIKNYDLSSPKKFAVYRWKWV